MGATTEVVPDAAQVLVAADCDAACTSRSDGRGCRDLRRHARSKLIEGTVPAMRPMPEQFCSRPDEHVSPSSSAPTLNAVPGSRIGPKVPTRQVHGQRELTVDCLRSRWR